MNEEDRVLFWATLRTSDARARRREVRNFYEIASVLERDFGIEDYDAAPVVAELVGFGVTNADDNDNSIPRTRFVLNYEWAASPVMLAAMHIQKGTHK